MKIGFDVSQTGDGKAGCGYYADNLIRALGLVDSHNQYLLYSTFGYLFWDAGFDKTCNINSPNYKKWNKFFEQSVARKFWENLPVDFEQHLGSPEIIHANNFFCPNKKLKNIKIVYTLYDLSFLENPDWTSENNRITCVSGVSNASIYADYIIAISQYSKDSFLLYYPYFPRDRIIVVYPASRFSRTNKLIKFDKLKQCVSGKFWLTVGTIEPRKNYFRLVDAYAKLKSDAISRKRDILPLAIAGGYGWLMDDFQQHICNLGLENDIFLLGYVNDSELQWLYQNCFAFIYPSYFEGFGLPVLEAMVLGAAVIASNVTSIPEIIGESGILIDPFDTESIYLAMQKIGFMTSNQLAQLKSNLSERVKLFSWEKSAEKILAVYEQLAAE